MADAVILLIYEALSTHTLPDRNRLFGSLSSDTKRHLWAFQLQRYIEDHPKATAVQQAVIQDALILLSDVNLFERTGQPGKNAPLARLEEPRDVPVHWQAQPIREIAERAKAAFGVEQARELFAQLGSSEVPTHASTSDCALPSTKEVGALADCSCYPYDDWCGLLFRCIEGGCTWSYYGCGTFLLEHCTGLCHRY